MKSTSHYIAIILLLAGLTLPTFAQDYPPAILERPNVSTNPNATTVSIRFVAYADSILARLAWFEARAAEQPAATSDGIIEKIDAIMAYIKSQPTGASAPRTVTIIYTWTQQYATGVETYHIERSFNDGDFEEVAVLPADARYYTAKSQPLGKYAWRMRAKTPAGVWSSYSNFKTLVVRAATDA